MTWTWFFHYKTFESDGLWRLHASIFLSFILFFLSFLFFFKWSAVDLQRCVSFWCTTRWFSYTFVNPFSYSFPLWFITGLPRRHSAKEPTWRCRRHKECGCDIWAGKIPGVRNGNPLQCACLENLMDRGAWRATVHGVTEPDRTEHTHTYDSSQDTEYSSLCSTGRPHPSFMMQATWACEFSALCLNSYLYNWVSYLVSYLNNWGN